MTPSHEDLKAAAEDLQRVLDGCIASNEKAFSIQGTETDKIENNRNWLIFKSAAADYAPLMIGAIKELLPRLADLERLREAVDKCAYCNGEFIPHGSSYECGSTAAVRSDKCRWIVADRENASLAVRLAKHSQPRQLPIACGTEVAIARHLDGSDKIERTAECEANEADRTITRLTAELASVTAERDARLGDLGRLYQLNEELIAEKAALEAKLKLKGVCGVCWTSSWCPVPADDPNAELMPDGQYARCDMCYYTEALKERNAKLAAIEAECNPGQQEFHSFSLLTRIQAILHPQPPAP